MSTIDDRYEVGNKTEGVKAHYPTKYLAFLHASAGDDIFDRMAKKGTINLWWIGQDANGFKKAMPRGFKFD